MEAIFSSPWRYYCFSWCFYSAHYLSSAFTLFLCCGFCLLCWGFSQMTGNSCISVHISRGVLKTSKWKHYVEGDRRKRGRVVWEVSFSGSLLKSLIFFCEWFHLLQTNRAGVSVWRAGSKWGGRCGEKDLAGLSFACGLSVLFSVLCPIVLGALVGESLGVSSLWSPWGESHKLVGCQLGREPSLTAGFADCKPVPCSLLCTELAFLPLAFPLA